MASGEMASERGKGAHDTEEMRKRRKMEQTKHTQAQANTPLYLSLLAVVAIVSFVVLGWATAAREAHAAGWAGLTKTRPAAAMTGSGLTGRGMLASPSVMAMLARGIAQNAAAAARMLARGRTTAAAVATDAAMRSAEVAAGAASGAARVAFDSLLSGIQEARLARQNGDEARSATLMARVASSARAVHPGEPRRPDDRRAFDGARLLNADGLSIGVIDHVSTTENSGTATIVVGGYHHVLGFLDFGGSRVVVPLERLAFGEPRAVGPTMAALGTFATTAGELLRESALVSPASAAR